MSKSTKEYKEETNKTTESSSKYKEQADKTTESTEKLKDETKKATEESKKFGDTNKTSASKLSSMGKVAGTTAVAVGTAITAVGGIAVGLANDMDKSVNSVIASTGESVKESERYQKVIEDIYKNNYGESFEDIATNMAKVKQQFGKIDDKELQNIIEKSYLMQDTFEIGTEESIRAVNSMMSQFGISSEKAYELMTQGAQKGLNQNGDLADQLAEYSVYYADMGYSAEEMFNAVANGTKDGAYQIDYLNDAIKEFGIRSKDGSDTSKKAFEDLGLNADSLTTAFANGGEGAKKAFDEVAKQLKNVDDKVLQNQIGVALFGTKFEDLGADAVLALTETNGAIDDTKSSLEGMEKVKYSSVGEMFEGLKRSVEMLLLPLGEQLIPIITELIETLLPVIEEVLPIITGLLSDLMPTISELLTTILPPLVDLILLLVETIMPVIELLMPTIIMLLQKLLPPLIEILNIILPPLIEILNILLEPFLVLIEELLPVVITLFDALIPCIEALMPVIKLLAEILSKVLGNSIENLMPLIEGVIDVLVNLMNFITAVFTGDWEKAWDSIVGYFKSVFNLLPRIIETVLNTAIGLINGLIGGINSLTGVVGITAIPNISNVTLPRFKTGIDLIPYDDMPALLHKGEAVLTASEAEIYRGIGGKGSLEKMLSQNVADVSLTDYKKSSSQNSSGNDKHSITIITAKLDLIIKLLKNQKQSVTIDGREMTIALKKYIKDELDFK